MVQPWQKTDPEQNSVDLVSLEDVPETGFKLVLEGEDQAGRILALIHDSVALRRMAVFDVVVNNADRKRDPISSWATGAGTAWTTDSPSTATTSCRRCCGLDRPEPDR